MIVSLAILLGSFIVLVASTARMSSAFDDLVDKQYEEHREEWVASGKPIGGKKSRKEASFWLSGISAPFVLQRWLLETPEWVGTDQQLLRLLSTMRRAFLGLLISTIAALAATWYFFSVATAA